MSYSDDYADHKHAEWLEKWAPRSKPLPEMTPERYRFTYAQAREAEAQVKAYRAGIAAARTLLGIGS